MIEKLKPFGELDCESEMTKLGRDEYSKFFFYQSRFNSEVLNEDVYLIIGRRGAGKTALSHFFSFQTIIPDTKTIYMNEPEKFKDVMARIAGGQQQPRELAIPQLVEVWNYVIWSLIFRTFRDQDMRIKSASTSSGDYGNVSNFIRTSLEALSKHYIGEGKSVIEALENIVHKGKFEKGIEAILEIAQKTHIILTIDTLEKYDIKDENTMRATAALIQCASNFNREFSQRNIQIKLFVMAEVFPYLKEEVVLNPLKFIRDEVHLHWRPKDLMRLICWRFWYNLKAKSLITKDQDNVDWTNHKDVQRKCWNPYFGEELNNGADLLEKTFPYVLRHTQLRPRQLILLCNSIARKAHQRGAFPSFGPEDLIAGIREAESNLAQEVFNSYSTIYPHAARIADALSGLPLIFKGNELDKRARQSAAQWPGGDYSPYAFRQFVAELGIVGRVRKYSEKAQVVEADFEYGSYDRLPINVTDECVIHPMFYKKLNIQMTKKLRVYPFPDDEEFRDLEYLG